MTNQSTKSTTSLQLPDKPFFILGPCVIESKELCLEVAETLVKIANEHKIKIFFKASYDKANRTSNKSFRGLGIKQGLDVLAEVREKTSLPILTDVHTPADIEQAAQVVDMLQTPAFLCRQTDLITAAAKSGKPVNYKKGQFLSPPEMKNVAEKALQAGALHKNIFLCERGFSFGYNNLVVDMRSLKIMRDLGYKTVFDATHSVQLPGGGGDKSSGEREMVPTLAKAAAAVGVDGFFMETHPRPAEALSDAANAWPLEKLNNLISTLIKIHQVANFSN